MHNSINKNKIFISVIFEKKKKIHLKNINTKNSDFEERELSTGNNQINEIFPKKPYS